MLVIGRVCVNTRALKYFQYVENSENKLQALLKRGGHAYNIMLERVQQELCT